VTRVRLVSAVDEPDAFGNFEVSKGVIFDVSRSGTPSGGGPIETCVDSTQDPLYNLVRNDLRVFEESSGQWIIGGDRQHALDLPWSYSLGSDGRLDSPTNGDPIHVAPGVFAAHFCPTRDTRTATTRPTASASFQPTTRKWTSSQGMG
jgi:hypothetical protein